MEKLKRKNGEINLRRYWLFFVPLTLFMALMVPHPLRFGIGELSDDGLLYGIIALTCVAAAVYIFRRAGKRARRLIALILLCAGFAAWQPFDIFLLRYATAPTQHAFGGSIMSSYTDYEGLAYFTLRFPDANIPCHFLYEYYFGNTQIAIAVDINRGAGWTGFCDS